MNEPVTDYASGADEADDLSPLAWVHGELRRSLEAAHKALRRYLKEAESTAQSDVDVVDPAVLRGARAQLHQGAGALDLVGLPLPAQVLRASEAAVQRMAARPALATSAAVDAIEKSSFAVLDFLGRQLVGKSVSPLLLFPQYREVLNVAGADRVHPADLWPMPWQWQELPVDPSATARMADDAARGAMESLVLALMRRADRAAMARMSDLCADLGAGARQAVPGSAPQETDAAGRLATFWHLAASLFEAQAAGLLATDVYTKRVASRLLAQLKSGLRGQNEPSERLALDLLFFCSQAASPSGPGQAPRLSAVRRAWDLDAQESADYETPRLGRFDPALVAVARKRVAAAKDAWSGVAGGELHRLAVLPEMFSLVGDSLQRLFPAGERLAQALHAAVAQTVAASSEPAAPLAMDVATGMLYIDACIEDGEFDHPQLEQRIQHLAQRIDDTRQGDPPRVLETWMEELYRRVSDRQTLGSVVQELRASLSEIEKLIDQYFRSPAQRELLIPVPAQLSAMRGVLSVLGMEQATQAVLRMRDDVDALAQTEVDPRRAIQTGTFDRLADNLGALSFLIDMISVQPQLAKSLFRFDAASGNLRAVMGRSERVSAFAALDTAPEQPNSGAPARGPASLMDQVQSLATSLETPSSPDAELTLRLENLVQQAVVADEPELAQTLSAAHEALLQAPDELSRLDLRAELAQGLAGLAAPSEGEPEPQAPAIKVPMIQAAPGTTGLEDDAEMREIFIEEAREVVADARAALERLAEAPESAADMTHVRRAFHTLKGSSRMLGLRDFGDAAWACEQLFNARIAQMARMDAPLRTLAGQALDYLAGWTEAINGGRDEGHRSADVAQAADALRLNGTLQPIVAPLAQERGDAAAQADAFDLTLDLDETLDARSLQARVPDLPSAADLDLSSPASGEPLHATQPEALSFEFDLSEFDSLAESAAAEQAQQPPAEVGGELLLDLLLGADAPDAGAPSEPMPLPEVEALEIDITDWGLDPGTPEPMSPPQDVLEATQVLGVDETAEDRAPKDVAPATEAQEHAPEAEPMGLAEEEPIKVIGSLRISIPLFNIFLNEADELSRRLCTELAEWALEHERHGLPESSVILAHSLAGSSATVGYADLSALARALEHALTRCLIQGAAHAGQVQLYNDAADEIRRLLHQFAAGFLPPVAPEILARLEHLEQVQPPQADVAAAAEAADTAETADSAGAAEVAGAASLAAEAASPAPTPAKDPVAAAPAPAGRDPAFVAHLARADQDAERAARPGARADAFDDDQDIDAQDALDEELFPLFEEEADELLPQLQASLRDWVRRSKDDAPPLACMRTLHTLKGGARLAGAMRLGEMTHRLETAIEHLLARGVSDAAQIEPLLARADAMVANFEGLRQVVYTPDAPTPEVEPNATSAQADTAARAPRAEVPVSAASAGLAPAPQAQGVAIDWQRFAPGTAAGLASAEAQGSVSNTTAVRVRATLLDRLVNQAGEVSITRSRIEADVKLLQGALVELTGSLDSMRRQLRDIELQAETQISTRLEAAKAASQAFDPLEMDRFTRFQELTRFMAESVNDVATLQRSLQRTLQSTEDQLAAQARLTRDLQDDLLRTRMVEFESLADRLYRTVRQAAKETGKQVRLDMIGGAIEIDRGVLDRMTGPFEHLLRNSVVHGVEPLAQRAAAGKEGGGQITIRVAQAGNEVAVEVEDDGAGLDLDRIRLRAQERGLLAPGQAASDAELAQLIFSPGFSTAESVTELAGRGVGMDVVRAEVNAMGGRVETASAPGRGTRFRLLLPLTTAVTQVVMLRCGSLSVAVPSSLVEVVRRVPAAEIDAAYASGSYSLGDETLPFFWLASLLQSGSSFGVARARNQPVVVIRSAAQRVALHVDEVIGNQEVVVKNVGPQLARLPGLAGVTLLPSGRAALIYNPVALATLYADEARSRMRSAAAHQADEPASVAARLPLVLVVDDSITVRRVTQRLLLREGYRVETAKDGLEAIERLALERPAVLLSDIEMPRMDGFDLLRNVRADAQLAGLPVIVITSRIAQKHRDFAMQLGADHYLGKPYAEDELLALVARYAAAKLPA